MMLKKNKSFHPVVLAIVLVLVAVPARRKTEKNETDMETVGLSGPNRIVLPVNQIITPAGTQISLPGLRPQALALSPDEKILAVSGKTHEVVVIDPATSQIRQRVVLPAGPQDQSRPDASSSAILFPDEKAQLSYTGLVFSPDGKRLYLSNVNGDIKVFIVGSGGEVAPLKAIALPPAEAPRRSEEIPAGLVVSADGKTLFACGNLSNRLLEIDIESGAVVRTFDVGVAPYDVVLASGKAYVSNWGGRRPMPGDAVGPAGQGTEVKVDPETRIAAEGSVSVIDLAAGRVTGEILVRKHASALALSPDGRYLVCANAASDNLSVIDTRTEAVVETIWVKPSPADLFGASPNALCFSPDGRKIFVANGTQNAIAVIAFDPAKAESRIEGLIPVGWFPGAVVFSRSRTSLYIANIKGHAVEPQESKDTGAPGFNSHQYIGSVTAVPVPDKNVLAEMSATVEKNYRRERIAAALLSPRSGRAPRPVPERIGEPSVFKHVVYVIKENRTYDQVLGDVPAGNGDPALCIFGERVTPNQHQLVREFVLLDNTYCSGILSAEGHQWSTTAFSTDYLERSFAGWPRSYPDGMGPDDVDALAYAPSGFLWDDALRNRISVWNFGEFMMPECRWADPRLSSVPAWSDFWEEYNHGGGRVVISCTPGIETIAPFSPTEHVGWQMEVPDVWRARNIVRQIEAWDREGRMPQLVFICLPNDHTSGTSEGSPIPEACVADNDLAFGRIVEALSRSRFWPETVVFGIEDDPQNGWDHVSGYRTTAYCVSPYTKRGRVVGTQYNTTSILRTIEQILGLPPMNQFDATATPMFDCFTEKPDFRPFTAVPNRVPLDTMNPDPKTIADAFLRRNAENSAGLNFARIDACPEDVLNRILWHAVKGSAAPYPSWAVSAVREEKEEDDP
ncbi:MAG: bifunctional YncE family protein/alkaline phosphatase family protein [Candidatus Aminicenantes bacterium]|nr:bifunctional YncE family protein/alkaline phosphatase family protein [Candidatus Aminicenantes bacterium]